MEILVLDRENKIINLITRKHILNLEFEDIINGVGKGYFTISLEKVNELYNQIKMNNRLLILINNKVVFGGFFTGAELEYSIANKIYFENILGRFRQRILREDLDLNGLTIETGVQELFNQVNIIYDEKILLNILDKTTIIEGGLFTKRTRIFDILQILLQKYDYHIKAELDGNQVSYILDVGELIGEDRSVGGNNFVSYYINLSNNKQGNINTLQGVEDINSFSNFISGELNGNYYNVQDEGSILEFGLVEGIIRVENNLELDTQKFLKEASNLFKGINLSTITEDYFEANLGDLVKLTAKGNKAFEIDSAVKIIGKSFKSGEKNTVKYKFNTNKITKKGFIERFNELIEKNL